MTETLLTNQNNNPDGWTPARETWTYASASTITVPSGAVSKYNHGDRIKLNQSGVKYFYVVAIADTLLTVTAGTDYTVANAAITDNFYSHQSTPIGMPPRFFYSPTVGGYNPTPTPSSRFFSINGNVCTVEYLVIGTSNSTGQTFTVPVATVGQFDFTGARVANAGAFQSCSKCRCFSSSIRFN